jgi:hypothetical protein
VPENWEPGVHWLVEVYDGQSDMSFPVGLAWVTHVPQYTTYLDSILVPDDWRGRGIDDALIEAVRERWPGVELLLPLNEQGS